MIGGVRRVLDVAADRGVDRAPWCGLQLVAWTVSAPIAAGVLAVLLLCVAPS